MIRGIVDRRLSKRVHTDLAIHLEYNGIGLEEAIASNISSGGMELYLPAETVEFKTGTIIDFCFNLSNTGTTIVKGQVRHQRKGTDQYQNNVVFYGIKFLDLSLPTWNSITEYCNIKAVENLVPFKSTPASQKIENAVHPVTNEFEVILHSDNMDQILGHVEDISFGGARVRLNQPIPINNTVIIEVTFETVLIQLTGICIWCAPDHNHETTSHFLIGVFFESLTETQLEQVKKLIQLLNSKENGGQ